MRRQKNEIFESYERELEMLHLIIKIFLLAVFE